MLNVSVSVYIIIDLCVCHTVLIVCMNQFAIFVFTQMYLPKETSKHFGITVIAKC